MTPSPHIVIAGGSGFLGTNLAHHLSSRGYPVVVLSRAAPSRAEPWARVAWDGRSVGDWAGSLDGASAIVNLAGRTVDCVKTPDHCDEILRSRVESTLALGRALARVGNPPPVWVQMSTAHIYGDPPEAIIDEDSAFGYGLAPTVGRAWEDAFHQASLPSQRRVILRTTFVLGRDGGALPRMAKLARRGLGGKLGSGRQRVSWIHERDMNRIFERAITDPGMTGAYIATAPAPVTNAEFMRELRRALRRPLGLPAPSVLVRLGAPLVMRTDPELALYGRACVPRRLQAEGFTFEFPRLSAALEDLFRKGG
ncbi:MAG TPA: TIGR01777 family oxidoreductase [Phycisphaerales bacterium]|nr:TIGR01777 family oxidoreductase [Phycisphaerales bacterium]